MTLMRGLSIPSAFRQKPRAFGGSRYFGVKCDIQRIHGSVCPTYRSNPVSRMPSMVSISILILTSYPWAQLENSGISLSVPAKQAKYGGSAFEFIWTLDCSSLEAPPPSEQQYEKGFFPRCLLGACTKPALTALFRYFSRDGKPE